VGDEIDHVQTGDVLLIEQVDGLGVLLAEQGHQHIGAADLLLAGGLDMEDGPLQDALEAQRRLGLTVGIRRQQGRGLVDEGADLPAQPIRVQAAGAQHPGRRRVVQQRQQQVLHGHVLVVFAAGLFEGLVQREFELFAKHGGLDLSGGLERAPRHILDKKTQASSMVHISGCW